MARARERLADVARRRATGWSTLTLVFAAPSPDLLQALSSRSVFRSLVEAVGWMDSDRDRFLSDVAALDAYAQRTDLDPDGASRELQAEHERLFGDAGAARLVDEMESLATLCREEQAAWAAGDDERAKSLRLDEHRRVGATIADEAPVLCDRIRATGRSELYRAAAGILLELVRIESGRHYPGAVLREVFPGDAG
jgi:hypothetical protein